MNQEIRRAGRAGALHSPGFWILFCVSLALHCVPALLRRVPLADPDELVPLELARSIWKGQGIAYHSIPLASGGVLYSLLLSPFFAVGNAGVRNVLLSLANGILLSSALIPARLLSVRLLKGKGMQFLALLALAVSPAMMLSVSFLPENLYLPLFLWAMVFAVRFFGRERAEGWADAAWAGFFAALLCLTRPEGSAFAAALAAMILMTALEEKAWKGLAAFALCLAAPLFGVRLACFGPGGLLPVISAAAARSMTPMDAIYYLLEAGFLLVFLAWGRFLLPAALPCAGLRTADAAARKTTVLTIFAAALTGLFAAWPLVTADNVASLTLVISARAFLPLLFPVLLLALATAEGEGDRGRELSGKEKLARAGGAALFLFAVFLLIRRVGPGGVYSAPVLHGVNALLTGSPEAWGWVLAASAAVIAVLLALRFFAPGKAFNAALCALVLAAGCADSVSFLAEVIPAMTAPAAESEIAEADALDAVLERLPGRVLVIADGYDSDTMRRAAARSGGSFTVATWEDLTLAAETGEDGLLRLADGAETLPVPEMLRQVTDGKTRRFAAPDWVVSFRKNIRLPGQFTEEDFSAELPSARVFQNTDASSFAFWAAPDYVPGTELCFSATDSSFLAYPHYGFSGQEIGFTWTSEKEAGLTLNPDRGAREAMTARITYMHVLGQQHLTVYANGFLLYEGDVESGGEDIVFSVPAEVFGPDGEIAFRFALPLAAPPGTGDPRTLGIAFSTFTLSIAE